MVEWRRGCHALDQPLKSYDWGSMPMSSSDVEGRGKKEIITLKGKQNWVNKKMNNVDCKVSRKRNSRKECLSTYPLLPSTTQLGTTPMGRDAVGITGHGLSPFWTYPMDLGESHINSVQWEGSKGWGLRTKSMMNVCLAESPHSYLWMRLLLSSALCVCYLKIWCQKRTHRPSRMTSRKNGYKMVAVCVVLVHNAYVTLGGYLSTINPTCPQGTLSLKAFASSKLQPQTFTVASCALILHSNIIFYNRTVTNWAES